LVVGLFHPFASSWSVIGMVCIIGLLTWHESF
jgi:hypothetical protein